jgi:hypothetical protein
MADDIDRANHQVELTIAAELAQKKPEGPKPTGVCLQCGVPVEQHRRWCDAACRDDWERPPLRRRY